MINRRSILGGGAAAFGAVALATVASGTDPADAATRQIGLG